MKLILFFPKLFLIIILLFIPSFKCFIYTHSQAINLLNQEGIQLTSTDGCSNKNNPQCTSLEGIHHEAIDGIITLKKASKCSIVITGGTEKGHSSVGARSHHNGWKIDIRKKENDCTTRYITKTFRKISANRWRAASGNVYLNEHNHWDIQYGNN